MRGRCVWLAIATHAEDTPWGSAATPSPAATTTTPYPEGMTWAFSEVDSVLRIPEHEQISDILHYHVPQGTIHLQMFEHPLCSVNFCRNAGTFSLKLVKLVRLSSPLEFI